MLTFDTQRAYFLEHQCISSLKLHILLQLRLRSVHVEPHYCGRNWGGMPHEVIQPGEWIYANTSSLSTGILPNLMALQKKCPHLGHTLLLLQIVERFAEIEYRSGWLQPHPHTKTDISQLPSDKTHYSDPCEGDQPLG